MVKFRNMYNRFLICIFLAKWVACWGPWTPFLYLCICLFRGYAFWLILLRLFIIALKHPVFLTDIVIDFAFRDLVDPFYPLGLPNTLVYIVGPRSRSLWLLSLDFWFWSRFRRKVAGSRCFWPNCILFIIVKTASHPYVIELVLKARGLHGWELSVVDELTLFSSAFRKGLYLVLWDFVLARSGQLKFLSF